MAKKQKFETDDFGFSKELEFEDMDFSMEEPKDDRNPVTKAASGFKEGVKNTAFSNDFAKRFIKSTLPKGYGDMIDTVGEATGAVSSLYHNSTKQLKPTIDELKKTTKRALPLSKKFLPKKLADKLDSWADDVRKTSSSDDYRESAIALQMADVFKTQMEDAARTKAENEVKAGVKANIDQIRHKDIFSQLDSINKSTFRLATYQDKITVNYQRKSLELQFRQYYAATELLEEQKKANEEFKTHMAEIVKNTGLPEYVKLQNMERFKDIARNKFFGGIHDTLFDKRNGYVNKVFNKFGRNVKEKISDFSNQVQDGMSAANMMMDGREMMASMGGGPSGYEMAGQLAGSAATDSLGMRAGKWLGKKLNSSKYGGDVRRVGTDLQYYNENKSILGDKFAKSDWGNNAPLVGGLIQMIKESMNLDKQDNSFQVDSLNDMQGAAVFNGRTRKSITDIIPGFLSRIYQELQIIRSGDSGIGLTTYDFTSSKFIDNKTMTKNIVSKLASKDQAERHNQDIDKLVDLLDPDKKLSKNERKILGKVMLMQNMNNKLADPEALANEENYRGISSKHRDKFSGLFKSTFGIDDKGKMSKTEDASKKRLEFSRQFSQLGKSFDDKRELIQTLINLGYHDNLISTGIIDNEGQMNFEKLNEYYSGAAIPNERKTTKSKKTIGKFNTGPINSGPSNKSSLFNSKDNSGFNNADYTEQIDESISVQKQMLEAINKLNSQDYRNLVESIASNVARIETILLESNFGSGNGKGSEITMSDRKKWYNKSIGDLTGDGVAMTRDGIKWLYKKAKDTGTFAKDKVMQGFDFAKTHLFKAINWGKKKKDDLFDVYVKGEIRPRLQKWRLEAGHYIDQSTKKVIEKFEDIKGTVVDRDGNIIMTAEDLKNIIAPSGGRISRALSYLKGLGLKAFNTANTFYGNLFNTAKQSFNFVVDKYKKLIEGDDVYVKGKKDPVLLAITMRAGGYRSKLTGKIIKRAIHIDGPIVDMDNNVVLTDAHLRKGIFDKEGKPFKSLWKKVADKAVAGFNAVKNVAKKGLDWVTDKVSGLGKGIGDFFSKKGLIISGGNTMVQRLTEIRDILDKRLPGKKKVAGDTDGDGIRDGSWQDNQRKKDGLLDSSKSKLGEAKAKAKGLYGGMAAGVAGLYSKLKGNKDSEPKKDKDGNIIGDVAQDYAQMKLIDKAGSWGKRAWDGTKRLGGRVLGKGKALYGLGKAALGLGAMGGGAAALSGSAGIGASTAAAGTAATAAGATGAAATGAGVAGAASGAAGAAKTGLLGKAGSLLGKAAVPLAAGLSVYDGVTDLHGLATGKTNVNSWDKENSKFGFMKMLNPWEAGKYLGANANKHIYNPLAQMLTGDKNASMGTAIFDLVQKLTGAEDPSKAITLEEVNKIRAKQGKPPLSSLKQGASANTTPSSTDSTNNQPKDAVANKANTMANTTTGAPATTTTITSQATASAPSVDKTLKPLDSVRYRTYGLVDLESSKIGNLIALENAVNKEVTMAGNNAIWKGSLDKIINTIGSQFGVVGVNSESGDRFGYWFSSRFMPIYLNYITVLFKHTGKTDPNVSSKSLTGGQVLDAANIICTSKGSSEGSGKSVWDIDKSPWENYTLNKNKESVDELLKQITDESKKDVVKDKQEVKTDKDGKATVKSETNDQGQQNKGFFANAWDYAKNTAKKAAEMIGTGTSYVAEKVSNAAQTAKDYAVRAAGAIGIGGGSVDTSKQGTGGSMENIPMPKGSGSWAALKDTILAAAKMVGVDENLMAIMAAIESGFKYDVKASTSSATGLYQFIRDTWNAVVKKHGSKYGITANTSPTDPRANALMGAEFLKNNIKEISPVLNRQPTQTDLYLAHFLGPAGARKFFKADPNAAAATVFPEAAKSNPTIFYDKATGTPKTISQVYSHFNNIINSKAKTFGLNADSSPIPNKQPAVSTNANDTGITDLAKGGTPSTPSTPGTTPPPSTQPANTNPDIIKTSATVPAANAPASVQPKSPIAPPVNDNPFMAGFDPNLAAQTNKQLETSKQDFNNSIGGVDKTLIKSLAVQESQLKVLENILAAINNTGGTKGNEVTPKESTVKPSSPPMQAKPPPIKMNRVMT